MPWKSHGLWGVRAGSRWPHLRDRDNEKDYLPYPFFLGYATSLLKKNGFDALLIDAIEDVDANRYVKLIDDVDVSVKIKSSLRKLSPREEKIVRMKFGLFD